MENNILSDDLQRIEQRLDHLERKVQILKVQRIAMMSLIGAMLIGFGAKAALTQTSPDVTTKAFGYIICRSITVVGKDGKKRVGIGTGDYNAGAISLSTADGKTTALLGSNEKRVGSLALWDSQQTMRTSVAQEITLAGPKFSGGVTLGSSANGGFINLFGQRKGQAKSLFPLWNASVNEDGGVMSISAHSPSLEPNSLRVLAMSTAAGGKVQTFKSLELNGAEAQPTGSMPTELIPPNNGLD